MKKNTSVWIEEEYLEKLKRNGFKLSDTINEYLKEFVKIADSSEKELNEERKRLNEQIKKDKIKLEEITTKLMKMWEDEEE